MGGLDTNLLARLLVGDDAAQLHRVLALIRAAQEQGRLLFVPITVMLELEWVLRSRYGYDRPSISSAMAHLLETREFKFQSEDALERALHAFNEGKADFADGLHAGLCAAASHAPLFTFDAKAARLADVQLLQ
jgi:predicted nucleic-acid-binding protein